MTLNERSLSGSFCVGWLESKKHCYPRGRQCLKTKLVITIIKDHETYPILPLPSC
nr:MAG TPA: hypothetical protein [Caudoviricetes sp.]